MSFGHYCFFYIAAASATLPLFTFGRLSFTILLAPFFALFRSLPICFCAAFALSAPCSSASCFLFPSVSPCSDAFCAALTFYSFYAQFPAHLSSPNKSRCPWPHSACANILVSPFYVFVLFLAKERKCKREFLHFNRKNYSFHGIFLSNIFGSLAKKLYFCIDCCREITCLVKSSLVFVLVNGSPVASETPINSYMSIVYVFIRNMNFLFFPFQPS